MRKTIRANALFGFFSAALGLFVLCTAASAHHGYGNSYDQSKWDTVTGKVTEFEWKNPHSGLYMDVRKDDSTIHYIVEMDSPGVLSRQGWTRHQIKVGDTVTVTVHPSTAGAPIGVCYGCKVIVNGREAPRLETPGVGRPATSG